MKNTLLVLSALLMHGNSAPGLNLGLGRHNIHLGKDDKNSDSLNIGLSKDGLKLSKHSEKVWESDEHTEEPITSSSDDCKDPNHQNKTSSSTNRVKDGHHTHHQSQDAGLTFGGGGLNMFNNKKQTEDSIVTEQESGKNNSYIKERDANSGHLESTGSEYNKTIQTREHDETYENKGFSFLGGGATRHSGGSETKQVTTHEEGSTWKKTKDITKDGNKVEKSSSNHSTRYGKQSTEVSSRISPDKETGGETPETRKGLLFRRRRNVNSNAEDQDYKGNTHLPQKNNVTLANYQSGHGNISGNTIPTSTDVSNPGNTNLAKFNTNGDPDNVNNTGNTNLAKFDTHSSNIGNMNNTDIINLAKFYTNGNTDNVNNTGNIKLAKFDTNSSNISNMNNTDIINLAKFYTNGNTDNMTNTGNTNLAKFDTNSSNIGNMNNTDIINLAKFDTLSGNTGNITQTNDDLARYITHNYAQAGNTDNVQTDSTATENDEDNRVIGLNVKANSETGNLKQNGIPNIGLAHIGNTLYNGRRNFIDPLTNTGLDTGNKSDRNINASNTNNDLKTENFDTNLFTVKNNHRTKKSESFNNDFKVNDVTKNTGNHKQSKNEITGFSENMKHLLFAQSIKDDSVNNIKTSVTNSLWDSKTNMNPNIEAYYTNLQAISSKYDKLEHINTEIPKYNHPNQKPVQETVNYNQDGKTNNENDGFNKLLQIIKSKELNRAENENVRLLNLYPLSTRDIRRGNIENHKHKTERENDINQFETKINEDGKHRTKDELYNSIDVNKHNENISRAKYIRMNTGVQINEEIGSQGNDGNIKMEHKTGHFKDFFNDTDKLAKGILTANENGEDVREIKDGEFEHSKVVSYDGVKTQTDNNTNVAIKDKLNSKTLINNFKDSKNSSESDFLGTKQDESIKISINNESKADIYVKRKSKILNEFESANEENTNDSSKKSKEKKSVEMSSDVDKNGSSYASDENEENDDENDIKNISNDDDNYSKSSDRSKELLND